MGTYAKSALQANIGATGDSFEDLGSAVAIPKFATHIHGFLFSWAENVRTAGEAIQPQIRWSAADYDIGNQIFSLNRGSGGAPATNIAPIGRKQELIPVDIPVEAAGDLVFEATSHLPDPTAGFDIGVSVLFNNGLSETFKKWFPNPIPHIGSDAEANAAITLTTEAAITDLEIQSWARKLTQFKFGAVPDAAQTDGDPVVPLLILRSSFKGFDPQEYVGPSISDVLGTAVGDGLVVEGLRIPIEIKASGSKETITPNVKLATASAANIAITADVYWNRSEEFVTENRE